MRWRSISERVEETGNVRGELCRLDRELKRRPPTQEERDFIEAAMLEELDDDLEIVNHAERIDIEADLRWNGEDS